LFSVAVVWTTDVSEKLMIAFSSVSSFLVQLPSGGANTSLLNVVVWIRDRLDCVTEVNMSTIRVVVDSAGVNDLLKNVQGSSTGIVSNPMIQLLASGNQNTVGQVIVSLSQQLNQMNGDSLDKAISSNHTSFYASQKRLMIVFTGGVPAASVSVSTLTSERSAGVSEYYR
jgi:hypothetical protein